MNRFFFCCLPCSLRVSQFDNSFSRNYAKSCDTYSSHFVHSVHLVSFRDTSPSIERIISFLVFLVECLNM